MSDFATRDVIAFAIVGFIVLVVAVVASGSSRRRPTEKFFSCWRCKAVTAHNDRTIGAWRLGKTQLFCGACHAAWLKSHPAPDPPARTYRGYGRSRRAKRIELVILLSVMAVISLIARSCS